MSLRNNKAAQLNRYMMFGMFFLGIVVLGCVFAFLYMSTSKEDNPFAPKQTEETAGAQDSVLITVNDSTLLEDE